MTDGPFTKRTVRWLVGICGVSFLGALALAIFGPEIVPPRSMGADTYSKAALGHLAFVELLRELDVPVVSSRHATTRRAGRDALLVIAEPRNCPPGSDRADRLREMVRASRRTLLVLPKWRGQPHRTKRGWVQVVTLLDDEEVEQVPAAAGFPLEVDHVLPVAPSDWWGDTLPFRPTFPQHTMQVLESGQLPRLAGQVTQLRELVACPFGVLLLEVVNPNGRLLVLSDPDLLANAGIGKGENAALAVAIVEHLRPEGGAVVFDEILHGYEHTPSIWRELFAFPLVVLMAQGLVVLVVLLWAGMGRFGSPERPPPPLEPGHRFLIRNTAELLRYRGHLETVLPLYLENTVQGARKALGAPYDLEGAELETWLDRVAASRGSDRRVGNLRTATRDAIASHRSGRVLDAARQIHRWNQEILHGPSDRSHAS